MVRAEKLFPIILLAAVAALHASAPPEGWFWWSDAPRHALNGVFVHDLLADLPWRDPVQWAYDYYLRYPAVTILFYPPLFPAVEALFFALFGISGRTALLCVAFFYALLAVGSWRLLRRWLPSAQAAAAALFVAALPEMALWGRQVMLEIPACALAVWAVHVFLRWLEEDRPRLLYGAAALLAAALYTKQTAGFLVPVLLFLAWRRHGRALFVRRHVWGAAVLFAAALAPLAALTVTFGQANLTSVTGIADAQVPRWSWRGWTYYLTLLPAQVGWPGLVLAGLYLVLGRCRRPGELAVLGGWFAVGYLFFSAIDLKEARHTTLILPPVGAAAFLTLARLLPARAATAAAWVLALGTLGDTLARHPVPAVAGYDQAARWVRDNLPPGMVMFSGKRDGAFIFNLRALDPQRRYGVMRADKMLLDVAIRRELGVVEKDLSPPQMTQVLVAAGISAVVAERDFWTDLKSMAALQSWLEGPDFRHEHSIAVSANIAHSDKELRIFRSRIPPAAEASMSVNLPTIGRSIQGSVNPRP